MFLHTRKIIVILNVPQDLEQQAMNWQLKKLESVQILICILINAKWNSISVYCILDIYSLCPILLPQ